MPHSKALIPRDTVEVIVRHRNQALALYTEAHELIRQADQLATRAQISHTPHSFSLTRHTLENIGRASDTFLKAARKELDRAVWRHLFKTSGLASLMDTTHHRKFNKQLEDDPPVVSEESIAATALTLASQADTMFIESVAHLYSCLSHTFASNDRFGFGPRIIFSDAYTGTWLYLHHTTQTQLYDLERVLCLLDKKTPPDNACSGLAGRLKGAGQPPFTLDDHYVQIKTYKNGNLHLHILKPELLELLNLTLAQANKRGLVSIRKAHS